MKGRRAQLTYALVLARAAHEGVARSTIQSTVPRLLARGNAQAQQALATMAAFSLAANKLGSSLFVQEH